MVTTARQITHAWESFLNHLEILLDYAQFLSIIASIRVPWPDPWEMLTGWLGFMRLAVEAQLAWPGLPVLSYYAHFMFTAILIPAAFCAIFVICFRQKRVVVWYIALLAGIGATIAGVVIELLPYVSNYVDFNGFIAIISGVIILVLCIGTFFAHWKGRRRQLGVTSVGLDTVVSGGGRGAGISPENDEEWIVEDVIVEAVHIDAGADEDFTQLAVPDPPPWYHNAIVLIMIVTLIVLGLFAMGTLTDSDYRITEIRSLGDGVGRLFVSIASILFVYFVGLLFAKGRVFWESVKAFLKANMLKLTIFLLATLYVPTTFNLASAWVCIDRTCPTGTRFPSLSLSLIPEILPAGSTKDLCLSCGDQSCSFLPSVCPAVTQARLAADVSLSCADVQAFFWPCSALMLAGFTVGIPVLFTSLIVKHTKVLKLLVSDSHTITQELWHYCLDATRNSARPLYMPFTYRDRFFIVARTVEKCIVVSLAVVLRSYPFILSTIMTSIWICTFAYMLLRQPYASGVQQMLSVVCNGCLLFAMIFPILLSLGQMVPSFTLWVLFFTVLLLPLVGVFLGKKLSVMQELRARREQGHASKKVVKAVDRNLNQWTLRIVTNFFLLVGVLAFVSYTILFVGVLYSDSKSIQGYDWVQPRTAVDTIDDLSNELAKFEYVGYNNFDEFCANCCCVGSAVKDDARVLLVERWTCLNGKTKLRLRSERVRFAVNQLEQVADGTQTERLLCASSFKSGVCKPQFRTVGEIGTLLKDRRGRSLPYLGWYQAHSTGCQGNTTQLTHLVPERLQHESLFLW